MGRFCNILLVLSLAGLTCASTMHEKSKNPLLRARMSATVANIHSKRCARLLGCSQLMIAWYVLATIKQNCEKLAVSRKT